MNQHLPLRRRLAGAATLLLLLPATASASTISATDSTVTWTGAATDDEVYLGFTWTGETIDPTRFTITGDDVRAGRGCATYIGNGESGAVCPARAVIKMDAGTGNDQIHVNPLSENSALEVDLGDGEDFVEVFTSGAATLHGGNGPDVIETSGEPGQVGWGDAGEDTLVGSGFGPDELHGGDGDDTLVGDGRSIQRTPDVLDGGAGRDTIADYVADNDFADLRDEIVSVTLDGVADDGFPGEGDTLQSIEDVLAYGTFTLTGDDGPNQLGLGVEEDLRVNDGSAIDGRGGDDVLTGTHKRDTLTGGAGRDTVTAGAGDDTVAVRDGEVDTVACGAGSDAVTADANDTVAADCERVDRPAPTPAPSPSPAPVQPTPGTPGKPGDAGMTPGTPPAGTTTGARVELVAAPRLRKALRRGLKVRVSGTPGETVTVRLLQGRKTVGSGTATLDASGDGATTVRFTKAAKRALRKRRRAQLTLAAGDARTAVRL